MATEEGSIGGGGDEGEKYAFSTRSYKKSLAPYLEEFEICELEDHDTSVDLMNVSLMSRISVSDNEEGPNTQLDMFVTLLSSTPNETEGGTTPSTSSTKAWSQDLFTTPQSSHQPAFPISLVKTSYETEGGTTPSTSSTKVEAILPASPDIGSQDLFTTPQSSHQSAFPISLVRNVSDISPSLVTELRAVSPDHDSKEVSPGTDLKLASPDHDSKEVSHNEAARPAEKSTPDLPTSESLCCSICQKVFGRPQQLKRHLKTHSDVRISCPLCEKTFKEKRSMDNHHRTVHQGILYNCTVCQKDYKTSHGLAAHKRTHDGHFRHMCDICGESYNYKSAFDRHVNKHANIRPHSCKECSKTFLHSADLMRHSRTCKVEGKNFSCDTCGKRFLAKRYLAEHVKGHVARDRYICQVCGETFSHRASLSKHRKRKHSDD